MITTFGISLVENGWLVTGIPKPKPAAASGHPLAQFVQQAPDPEPIVRVAGSLEEALDQVRILSKRAESHRQTQAKLEDDATS